MNGRRDLLIVLGATALTPRAALAQSKRLPILIGWLGTASRESSGQYLAAFRAELAALGWKEGSRVMIEERWASGRVDRLPSLAQELAARKPALIVAAPLSAVAAAAKAAPKTPIVQATGGDLVATGFAKSLASPGGMVTGLTNVAVDLTEKFLELLLAVVPKVRRVGFLTDSTVLNHANLMAAAHRSIARYSIEARFAHVTGPEEIEPAISRLANDGAQALVVLASGWFGTERRRIISLALAQRWPMVGGLRIFAEAGALLTYAADTTANYLRAASYVDRILKGAKPGDLPIEQPTKFELVINMKTARALKLEIPRELAVRADKVIE